MQAQYRHGDIRRLLSKGHDKDKLSRSIDLTDPVVEDNKAVPIRLLVRALEQALATKMLGDDDLLLELSSLAGGLPVVPEIQV